MKKDIHKKIIKFGSINLSDWVLLEVQGELLKVEEFLQGQVTSDISLLSDNWFYDTCQIQSYNQVY